MKFLLWITLFLLTVVVEVSLLPRLFGTAVPAFGIAVLLFGVAFQEFAPALWFAGSAGIFRDLVAPPADATHTIFFLATALVVHLFGAVFQWDEPARRIGGIACGILALPLTGAAADWIARTFFHLAPSTVSLRDLFSFPSELDAVFTAIWFSLFVWLSVRWFRKQRTRSLGVLP